MKTRKLPISTPPEFNDKVDSTRKAKSQKVLKVKKDSLEESYRDLHNIGKRKSNSSVVTYSLNSHLFFDVYAKFDQQNVARFNGGTKLVRKSSRCSLEKTASIDSVTLRSPTIEDLSTDAMSYHDYMSDKSSPKRLKVICEAPPLHKNETLIPSPQMDSVSPFRSPRQTRTSFPDVITPQLSLSASNHSNVMEVPSTNTETFHRILENKTVFKKHLSKVMAVKKTVPKTKSRTKVRRTALMRLCKVTKESQNGEREVNCGIVSENKNCLIKRKIGNTKSNLKVVGDLPPREKRMASLNAAAIINCVQSLFSDRRRSLSKSTCVESSPNKDLEDCSKIDVSTDSMVEEEKEIEIKCKQGKVDEVNKKEHNNFISKLKKAVVNRKEEVSNGNECKEMVTMVTENETMNEGNYENEVIQENKNTCTRKCKVVNKSKSVAMKKSKSVVNGKEAISKPSDSIVIKNICESSDGDSKGDESHVTKKTSFSQKIKMDVKKNISISKIGDEIDTVSKKLSIEVEEDNKNEFIDQASILKPDQTVAVEKEKKTRTKTSTGRKGLKVEKGVANLKANVTESNHICASAANNLSRGNSGRFFDITTPVSQKQRERVATMTTKKSNNVVNESAVVSKEVEEAKEPHLKCSNSSSKNGQMVKKVIKKEEEQRVSEEAEDNVETLWLWDGDGREQTIQLQLAGEMVTRTCYPAIRHAKDDVIIRVSDSVMLRSADQEPYLAKITAFFFDEETGKKMMAVLWYYRPEHTDQGRMAWHSDADVYASRHLDTNLVDCIEDKAFVLPIELFARFVAYERRQASSSRQGLVSRLVPLVTEDVACEESKTAPNEPLMDMFASDFYYATNFLTSFPPEMTSSNVFVCRGLYELQQHRVVENVLSMVQSPIKEPLSERCPSVNSAMSISSCHSSEEHDALSSVPPVTAVNGY